MKNKINILVFVLLIVSIAVNIILYIKSLPKPIKKSDYYVYELATRTFFTSLDTLGESPYIQVDVDRVTLNDGYLAGDTIRVSYKNENYSYLISNTYVIIRKINKRDDMDKGKIIYEKKQ